MSPRTRTAAAPAPAVTTAQRLASIVKSARDIMRKDKGLNGDLDRLPMLVWIMFLKFLDDLDRVRETEAQLAESSFVPTVESPYRWRDWAANNEGITGNALLSFVNDERVRLPDGSEIPGLFAYLRSLQGAVGGDRRDVVAAVFRGTVNRMINGYLLRDMVNKVDEIHFASSDETHTLGLLYESMLREMRDAAGDSGEFYTPRPLVRFMVTVVDPRPGETVLDPACGTGGFLVEAFAHMLGAAQTAEDRRAVEAGVQGGEAKPLPFLLAQMNLLLHGVERPRINTGNSLNVRLAEIGERDRVDVVLTNPPFGGEEERGVLDNFPADRRTGETALLFLQLIMRRLKRPTATAASGGRAAVVVPNGILSADGVAARVKQDLVEGFNLHTVVRLPNGVFSPYTPIPTNLLFFDRSGPTDSVWYYEHPLPSDRKAYTKTNPVKFDEFTPLLTWWGSRVDTERAWKVPVSTLRASGYNLDLSNPNRAADPETMPAEDLVDLIASDAQRLQELMATISKILTSHARS